jgi:hypothetical protein
LSPARAPIHRTARWVASSDSFIALGDAALEVLLSEDDIEAAAMKLVGSAERAE